MSIKLRYVKMADSYFSSKWEIDHLFSEIISSKGRKGHFKSVFSKSQQHESVYKYRQIHFISVSFIINWLTYMYFVSFFTTTLKIFLLIHFPLLLYSILIPLMLSSPLSMCGCMYPLLLFSWYTICPN